MQNWWASANRAFIVFIVGLVSMSWVNALWVIAPASATVIVADTRSLAQLQTASSFASTAGLGSLNRGEVFMPALHEARLELRKLVRKLITPESTESLARSLVSATGKAAGTLGGAEIAGASAVAGVGTTTDTGAGVAGTNVTTTVARLANHTNTVFLDILYPSPGVVSVAPWLGISDCDNHPAYILISTCEGSLPDRHDIDQVAAYLIRD